jgi:hypothetical protein
LRHGGSLPTANAATAAEEDDKSEDDMREQQELEEHFSRLKGIER